MYGTAISKNIRFTESVEGHFLPYISKNNYQLLHIIDNRISHLKIKLNKNSIDIEKIRGGLHLPETVWYSFDYLNISLQVIYLLNKKTFLSVFQFSEQNVINTIPIEIAVFKESQIPHYMTGNPNENDDVIFAENQTRNMFVFRHNRKFCVIQQLRIFSINYIKR